MQCNAQKRIGVTGLYMNVLNTAFALSRITLMSEECLTLDKMDVARLADFWMMNLVYKRDVFSRCSLLVNYILSSMQKWVTLSLQG